MSPRWLAPLLGLVLAGCPDEPPACPGDRQGTFGFSGTVTAKDCELIAGTTGFPATISFTGDASAVVCLDRLLTEPRVCQRSGDALSGCTAGVRDSVPECPCPVRLAETLSGTLLRAGARATGFSGTLVAEFTRGTSNAAVVCYAEQDPLGTTAKCPPAAGCTATYAVTAAP